MPEELTGGKQPSSIELSPSAANEAERTKRHKIEKAQRAAAIMAGATFICPKCNARQSLQTIDQNQKNHCSSCDQLVSLIQSDLPGEGTDTSAPSLQATSDSFGNFELIEKIGAGGFGDVWKAFDKKLNRIVAVKIPRAKFHAVTKERFVREAKMVAQLDHPYIVNIFELGEYEDGIFIVSQFVEGITLDQWREGQQKTVHDAAQICKSIAEAVSHAHHHQVIHRDLKPQNILVDVDDKPHILDFGLAKSASDEMLLTVEGAIIGTPAYMSPEQAVGNAHEVEAATDIYSLGVILYELVTGELPFRGTREMLVHQILLDDPLSPRRLNQQVPRDLETICLRCLEKDPDLRFPSAQQLAEELGRFVEDIPIESRPISHLRRLFRWCRRNRLTAGLITAVFMALLLGSFAATWFGISAAREAEFNRKLNYVLGMNLVQQMVEDGNKTRAIEMLNSFRPRSGETDLRQFEWQYWWDRCHEHIVKTIDSPSGSTIRTITRSPDGKRIVWSGESGKIHSCDANSFELLPDLAELASPINSIRFVTDRKLVAATDGGEIWLMPALGGATTRLAGLDGRVVSVAVLSDGRFFGGGGNEAGGQIGFWNPDGSTIELDWLSPLITDLVTEVVVSADENLLAFGMRDGKVIVVELKDGNVIYQHQRNYPASSLAFLDDERIVISDWAATNNDQLKIVNLTTGDETVCTGSDKPLTGILGIVASADGERVAAAASRGLFQIFDVATGKHVETFSGATGRVLCLDISPDGQFVMSGGDDGKLRVWHVGHERDVQRLGRPTFKLPAAISNLDINSDQQTLLATDANGVLTIWNLGDQQRIASKATSNEATTAELSPLGTQVVLVRANDTTPNSVHLWDYRSDEETKLADFEFPVKRLEFSPDGRLLVVAGGKDSVWPGEPTPVCVIDMVKRRQLFQCYGHLRTVMDIRFLDDGMKFATSGSDRTVRLWDSRTGKCLQSWKPNKTDKHAYYFPRGRIGISNNSILAAYYNGSLVKMNQGQTEQTTIANIDQHLVDWFEVAADGETALSVGLRDDFLAVLDIPTGKVRSYLPLGGLKKASFALSGDRLAIGDEQGQIRIMDIGPPPE